MNKLAKVAIASGMALIVGFSGVGASEASAAKATAKNLYKKVEVSVDYGRQELEFEFEVKSNGRVEVEFENDFTRKKLRGAAAQAEVDKAFATYNVSGKTRTQIVNHILKTYKLSTRYQEFDFEAKLKNNKRVAFEIER
ncbi:YusW family protein [Listeria riparia]|uniref:Uncharacterized protein n=1 Tax=Listeria riparia FSL S10-1204 TaxID=1265816 RepID=W7D446_9LIST|nr:YusW family protein [Listeria riparia]EUJ42656.1 hypothetical protein PRIP_15839 [Listeria riparia FSL S10-1204]